ncbi:DUF2721 domain-containing protein [Phragmitibacter flavus]|uniref:DUF2721 domain-containing protein n=1 Tax=Phragmitibacter flavus TaxID=2576071 RepID=UPI0014076D42|nr:DUF2721 domain-containing protein [Phragmitibacter flavus]
MITEITGNPFALLSLIAAPAVLTNAASLLALSTSNRFLRAGERLRAVIAKVEKAETKDDKKFWLRHMDRIEKQASLLLGALRAIYVSLGSFVLTSLVSIFGAALASQQFHPWDNFMMALALSIGFVGAIAIVQGCLSLFRATRLSLINIHEEADLIRQRETACFTDNVD